jgi:PKD repeat protein
LEKYLQENLVGIFDDPSQTFTGQGYKVQIVAGSSGYKETLIKNQFYMNVPSIIWKAILVLKPNEDLSNLTTNTISFAVSIQNDSNDLNGNPIAGSSWTSHIISVNELEARTGYNFFSNIATDIQEIIESNTSIVSLPAALMAEPIDSSLSGEFKTFSSSHTPLEQSSIVKYGSTEQDITTTFSTRIRPEIDIFSPSQIGKSQTSIGQGSSIEIGSSQRSTVQVSSKEAGISQISSIQTGIEQNSTSQISPSKISISKSSVPQNSTNQTGIREIGSHEMVSTQIESHQISITKVLIPINQKIQDFFLSQSWGVNSQNFGSIDTHTSDSSQLLSTLQSTLATYWNMPADLNLNFEITNLPTGQLAEATITGYDKLGRPNTATITLDDDANGVGWFLDTTPQDNSEFTGINNYLQATPNSAASGKYDLLTTILHEMGHTLGIINGYSEFDKYVKNGIFTTDTFTTKLTPDGSHLDTTFHPYDLMNTSLKPGVRKLPSALNLAMIDAINAGIGNAPIGAATLRESGIGGTISAPLTAGALLAINNGDFSTTADWNTLGATNIINGTATLTEQSQKLSELTQAFIIPTGAKTLQFTIKDNHLIPGDTTKTANDAFEVALLDTNTFNPLAGTSIGLNHTDSLLNIQANGTIHKSDKVTITALGNNSSIVTIDLTQITPSTQATLYFNLLGFGARTSTITIDDVKLFTDTQPIPITKNDTLTTNQNTPLTLDPTQLTTNDTNVNTIQIITQPTHGTLTQNPNGKLTYTPIPTYIGNDSFTYLGIGTDGQISNLATVNLTINNLPPTIETLIIPTKINEGQTIQLKATATDGGSSDNLTYTWDLGDGSQPIIGQNITHQFLDNGTYNVNLTVTDFNGSSTQQSTQITVDNLAPTLVVDKLINTNINQGETITFGANYSDSGSNDSLNITWDFGDGSEPISFVNNPSHQFTKAGTYNVTVTITDNDGASTTDTIPVTINNLAPTINTIEIPTNIKEGETVQLTANATDAGNDSLTYNWYINGATTPIIGQTIDYNFPNSGTYPVKLEVIDSNGAITTQTVDATITNVAPTINQITIPTNIKEGDTIQLIATASDIGNDALTYNWYINNSVTPITGATIDYTFTDNGIYPVKLEVIDTDGAVTTQTVDVTVANIAPSIVNIVKPATIKEGESVTFSATATDPGILDTLTYSWNFGDNTNPVVGQNVNHTFADNGNYNRVLITKQTFQTASNLWINLAIQR